jgi:hypothetical protein
MGSCGSGSGRGNFGPSSRRKEFPVALADRGQVAPGSELLDESLCSNREPHNGVLVFRVSGAINISHQLSA